MAGRARGIEHGLIHVGKAEAETYAAWLANAGQRVLDYEDGADDGGSVGARP